MKGLEWEWVKTLKKEVDERGLAQVARELGVSKATVSLVIAGKYGASTDKIKERVGKVYALGGPICPVLGSILPQMCADNRDKANKIGLKAGNPENLRLYVSCLKCGLNGG